MIIYLFSGIFAVALLVLHLLGNAGFYFQYDWYDVMMHIMGGITLGFLGFQVAISHRHIREFSWKKVILAVFLIGLAWEIFEAIFNIAGAPLGTSAYYVDTVKDLFNDCLGAGFAVYVATSVTGMVAKNKLTKSVQKK